MNKMACAACSDDCALMSAFLLFRRKCLPRWRISDRPSLQVGRCYGANSVRTVAALSRLFHRMAAQASGLAT